MIEKYGNMTVREIVATLTPRMRDALHAAIETEHVDAPTSTAVALIDRGIIEAGRSHPLTTVGRAVVALLWPDETAWVDLAREYERKSGRSAHGLTADVLRALLGEIDPEPHPLANCGPLVMTLAPGEVCPTCGGKAVEPERITFEVTESGRRKIEAAAARNAGRAVRACCSSTVGSEHEGTCASIGARCERAVEAMRHPRPSRTVRQLGVWTAGDRVHVVAAFSLPGDVWTIRELVVYDDAPPCAAIELTHRSEGGMPLGTTSSAVGIEWLRPLPARIPPRGVIELTESLMSAARTAASSSGQFVEYNAMRAALRAAFRAVGFTVEISPGLDAPDAPTAPAVGGVA